MSYKPRKCKLQNWKTGKIIEAKSISEFCRLAGLSKNDKFHLTPVLDAKPQRYSFKGWHIPRNDNFNFKDIHGNEYKVKNVIKFALENGIHLSKLFDLIDDKISIYNGLFLKERPQLFKKRSKLRIEIERNGVKLSNISQSKLANIIHIDRANISNLVYGKYHQAKGWKLSNLTEIPNTKKLFI